MIQVLPELQETVRRLRLKDPICKLTEIESKKLLQRRIDQ
jgi:hypothetical protein